MLKGQDIILLLRLLEDPEDWTVRSLADPLGFDPATVHRSLNRLGESRILNLAMRRADRSAAEEFLLHGFKYVFPVRQGGDTVGVPTAWAAPPLRNLVAAQPTEHPPVWPHPLGEVRGIGIEPIHPKVPDIVHQLPGLGEDLAILDGLRLGDARLRELAAEELRRRLRPQPVAVAK